MTGFLRVTLLKHRCAILKNIADDSVYVGILCIIV